MQTFIPTTVVEHPPVSASTHLNGSSKAEPSNGEKTLADVKLGFIGWGSMAQAVSLGIAEKDLIPRDQVMTSAGRGVVKEAQEEGFQSVASNLDVMEFSDIVVIAVKPQVVDKVLKQLAPAWKNEKVLVSLCAGVTIDTFKQSLGEDAKVVRVMTNTPCLVGEGATAYSGCPNCEEWELDLVEGMLGAVGNSIHRLDEKLLNAVTGVSGSGPAYIYMLIGALTDAGIHGGLSAKVAQDLATQTVIGAAKMVQETGEHPSVLKSRVMSPAGTTIAGVRALEKHGFNAAVMDAVDAARERAEELSAPAKKK